MLYFTKVTKSICKKNTLSRAFLLFSILTIAFNLSGCGETIGTNTNYLSAIQTEVSAPVSYMKMSRSGIIMAPDLNTEIYSYLAENSFKDSLTSPLSTFSADVDTASYSNVRRMLRDDSYPVAGAVRVEEMINYFSYDYPQPQDGTPVAVYQELSECPWNSEHQLLHIGLQAKKIDMSQAPQANLVFLIDVSGSMHDDLLLVKRSLKLLTEVMSAKDRISIVVYAGASGMILPPTTASDKQTILAALDKLESGGATAGSEGIELAYELAEKNFIEGGNNRIILATDGDFNVGLTSEDALVRLISKKREKGIYLTVLGFGMLNYDDVTSEALADHGNGNYAYIDNLLEAKKVLVTQAGATLVTVAKDVKLQVEFNPAQVKAYRLIGYENRLLNNADFADDSKDAGDMGAGHTVTALYEIIPQLGSSDNSDTLRYQQQTHTSLATGNELAYVKYRYKAPTSDTSEQLSFVVDKQVIPFDQSSENQRFVAAVAAWAMLLKDSEFKGSIDFDWITQTARNAKGTDLQGERAEFVQLVELSKLLKPKNKSSDI